MDKNMLMQYIDGLHDALFSVIKNNENEFIDKFIRAEDDTRDYRLHELFVNTYSLFYSVEIGGLQHGWMINDTIRLAPVVEWVCSKTTEEGPDDTSSSRASAAAG